MESISVIIPAFNREIYVGQAIESALGQTYPPIEIIVVDDGSTDRTVEVARSYGSSVRCIWQENQGVGAARNTGLKEARGSHIALLDSDDLWDKMKLELQAVYLRAHPETDMVFCHMKPFLSPEIDPAHAVKFDPRPIAACNAASLLACREVFDRAGNFPTARNIPEFFPWFVRAGEKGFTHHILPDLLLLRRVHLGNSVHDPQSRLNYVRYLKQRLDQNRGSTAFPG
jgi:glycosyltransferase involved in cell wall biosynthesis